MKKARATGFTIVEVMIVLVVTAGLFLSAALLINGRQNKTQFSQAIRQIQTDIQQTINDVGSGFYPSSSNFTCQATVSGPNITAGTNGQGTNNGCIFMGKALQFKVQGTDPEKFNVFSLAGLQKKTGTNQEASSLAEALPVVAEPATDTKTLQYGLTTHSMTYNGGTPIGAVAFVNSLAQYGTNGTLSSGSQQVDVVPIAGTALDTTQTVAIGDINSRTSPKGLVNSTPNPSGGVQICFVSGGTDQSGLITIGSNGRQLSVTLKIKANRTCA